MVNGSSLNRIGVREARAGTAVTDKPDDDLLPGI